MFVVSTVLDTLFIPASSFNPTATSTQPPTSAQSLALALNTKYANRVIPDVGLCVCLFDIQEASEGKVKWGDGGLWHKLKARLVVFRPFVGEVLVGKVKSSDESGIKGEQAVTTEASRA
jgi:DNA-directed RNA polymerase III subunit RPC8